MELTQENVDQKGADLARDSMTMSSGNSDAIAVKIENVQPNQVTVSYTGLVGNAPNTYGNYIALWQGPNSIPWNKDPDKKFVIPGNSPDGSTVFADLNVTTLSYVIGYAVGPEIAGTGQKQGNICASAYIAAYGKGSPDPQNKTSSLAVSYIGSTSIAVKYELPDGATPMSNGAWIALWQASQPSYSNTPLASNNIQADSHKSGGFLNDINLQRGVTYTVGLFTSGWAGAKKTNTQTALACYVTFTT